MRCAFHPGIIYSGIDFCGEGVLKKSPDPGFSLCMTAEIFGILAVSFQIKSVHFNILQSLILFRVHYYYQNITIIRYWIQSTSGQ